MTFSESVSISFWKLLEREEEGEGRTERRLEDIGETINIKVKQRKTIFVGSVYFPVLSRYKRYSFS